MQRHPQSDVVWEKIRCADCVQCSLHKTADTVCLLGDGPVPCDGMIIGEAPGSREDSIEIPFSGRSGLLLRKTLKEIGLDPRTLFITNAVSCRPPGNRTPTMKEVKTCGPLYLIPQIDLVKPKAILLLGNTAISAITGKKAKVTSLEGTTLPYGNAICVPSRHPASLIYAEDSGVKEYSFLLQQFRENLLLFKKTLFPVKDEFKFMPLFDKAGLPNFIYADKTEDPVYTDLESNGLNPFKPDAKIWSIGFAQLPARVSCEKLELKHRKKIRTLLENYPIMAHRATFEGTWYRQHFGITPRIYYDTKLGSYLQDENEPSGLKYEAIRHLGVDPWSEDMDFQNPDMAKLLPYNARDVKYGLRLYRERDLPFLKKNPKIARLMHFILLPATEVLIEMICNGFHINEKEAKKKLRTCETEKKIINDKLNKVARKEVNPGSPKQMSQLLYGRLKLKCPVKTPKGANSTSEASLIRLRGQHPATDLLWDWRGWDKKRSTYLEPWLRQGPILHASYGNTDTDTGRLNSTMVKDKRHEKGTGGVLHQCPREAFIRNLVSPRGYAPVFDPSRSMWVMPGTRPHPEDWCIVAGDLSQVEMRLVAHAANEQTMIEIFQNDPHTPEGDIHLSTAMDVLKKAKEEIDKETRKKAKAVGFGFLYGMFPPKFQAYALEKFDLKLTLKESKDYRAGFFEKYSGLLPWHRRVEAFVTENGWIDSILGRRRHLPHAKRQVNESCPDCVNQVIENCFLCGGSGYITHGEEYEEWVRREAVRQAINSPIQGAASDILLFILALIASYSLPWDFKIDRKRLLPIGSAHDSGLFECRRDYAKEFMEGLIWTVKNLPLKKHFDLEMKVPILMDCAVYETCWEGKELKL